MFETDSKISSEFIREIKPHLVNPKVKKRLLYMTVFGALGTVVCLLLKYNFLAIVFVAVALIFARNLLTLEKTSFNATLKLVENGDFVYKIKFGEEQMHIKNLTTDLESHVPCYEIEKVVETKDYLVLFTRKWQFVPIFKDTLEDVEEFKKYLKNQAPCMEIIQKGM